MKSDAEGELVLLYLSVSCSCQLLRCWVPFRAQRVKVKEKPVRILIALRSDFSLNILRQQSAVNLLLFGSLAVQALRGQCKQLLVELWSGKTCPTSFYSSFVSWLVRLLTGASSFSASVTSNNSYCTHASVWKHVTAGWLVLLNFTAGLLVCLENSESVWSVSGRQRFSYFSWQSVWTRSCEIVILLTFWKLCR